MQMYSTPFTLIVRVHSIHIHLYLYIFINCINCRVKWDEFEQLYNKVIHQLDIPDIPIPRSPRSESKLVTRDTFSQLSLQYITPFNKSHPNEINSPQYTSTIDKNVSYHFGGNKKLINYLLGYQILYKYHFIYSFHLFGRLICLFFFSQVLGFEDTYLWYRDENTVQKRANRFTKDLSSHSEVIN